MTPHTSMNRGTFIIDRRYRHVGRIKRTSGTKDRRVFKRMLEMLNDISNDGRIDVLRAVRDGHLKPLELWSSYRRYGLSRLPSVERVKPLQPAIDTWLERLECSEEHRRNYRYALNKVVTNNSDVVSDLPERLRTYRKHAKSRMFNVARSACQAFFRDTVGRYDELWRDVSATPTKKVNRRRGKPQTPQEAERIRLELGDVYGQMWWAMCVTGMGPKEYWGEWDVRTDRIFIHGTKRETRDRVIPKIESPEKPNTLYKAFRRALSKYGVQPYDARRTYAHWMELAKIDRTRRRIYLGHTTKDTTDLYEDHMVEPYLAKDGRALRTYLRRELQRLRLAK